MRNMLIRFTIVLMTLSLVLQISYSAEPERIVEQYDEPLLQPLIKKTPDFFTDVAAARGGEFLLLYMPRLKQIAVFDVKRQAISHYIQTNSENAVFAAGATKVLVCPDGIDIRRFDLQTGAFEAAAPIGTPGNIISLTMGSDSEGPLLAQIEGSSAKEVDIRNLHTIQAASDDPPRFRARVRASANGKVFGSWDDGMGFMTHMFSGASYYNESATMALPGPSGKFIYTYGLSKSAVFSSALKDVAPGLPKGLFFLPADEGTFFFGVPKPVASDQKKTTVLYLFSEGVDHAIAMISDIPLPALGYDQNEIITFEKRIHMVPSERVIIIIPEGNDQINIYPFDPIEIIKKNKAHPLMVTSTPSQNIGRGCTLSYQIKVKSKFPVVVYKLEFGPNGMKVSPDGLLTWDIPNDFPATEAAFAVKVLNSGGEEAVQDAKLKIGDKQSTVQH
jgi:hypothetical protein